MSTVRLGLAAATAGLALLVGTAHALPCPPGFKPVVNCTPKGCFTVCVPDLGI
jgi:hypothetical protein